MLNIYVYPLIFSSALRLIIYMFQAFMAWISTNVRAILSDQGNYYLNIIKYDEEDSFRLL